MKILVAGEVNVDLVLQNTRPFPSLGREVLAEDASLAVGGSSALCASGLAKLGDNVIFVGKVGCDPWGELCLNSLTKSGVDCSLIARDPTLKTGITVSIASAKDRAFVTYQGSTAALEATDVPDDALRGMRHLHVSSYFLQHGLRPGLKKLFLRAHANGLTTSLDPGYDPAETWDRHLIGVLEEVDVFLPNEVELACLGESSDPVISLRALQNGRTLTVAKLGKRGCMTTQGDEVVSEPGFPVQPLDTTGAGDTFNAGFLHAWLRGGSLREAMRFAAACGALSTLGLGGMANQPTVTRAKEFIAEKDRSLQHGESE